MSKRGKDKMLADQAKADAVRRELIGRYERARIHRNLILTIAAKRKEKAK